MKIPHLKHADYETNQNIDYRIAVIGMACRFPGAKNIDEYWSNLVVGKNSVSFFSNEQLNEHYISKKLIGDPNYVAARGILDNVYCFDAEFFGFSPYEAKIIDPQQRVFLELAWTALEDAGYINSRPAYHVGVYAGMSDSTYLHHNLRQNKNFLKTADYYQLGMSTNSSFLSSRVSYLLNLKGPSVSINTACSTSLVAIVSACNELVHRNCDIAIAGGVSIQVPQESGYLYQKGGVFSPDGQCKAFDAKANGIVVSNGAGVVILKRLVDAIEDHDHIEAVILGYAVNNDGADKVGYTAPSVEGQMSCIKTALSIASISPEKIGYVEAHGTGTPMGDPIEVAALTKAFRYYTPAQSYCALGSVKTNIGHTDVASGVAGFIKAVLSVKHGIIPPNLHFKKANPAINFEESPFFVNSTLHNWSKCNFLRKASVNSLGMGGTNAHVILEQFSQKNTKGKRRYYLLPYSAKEKSILLKSKENLEIFLQKNAHQESNWSNIKDIAYTLQQKRMHFAHRGFIIANNIKSIQCSDTKPLAAFDVHEQLNKSNKLCFMFTGQGSQYLLMGKALYDDFSIFRQCVDLCSEKLLTHIGCDLRTVLFSPATDQVLAAKKLQQPQYMQPAIFIIEYSLSKLLASFGIRAEIMIGHSIGEYVAAHLAGVFSLDEVLRLIVTRAKIISELKSGAMLAVSLEVYKLKEILPKELSIAAINAPDLCIVSGEDVFIEKFIETLCQRYNQVNTKRLQVSHAFHSHMMDGALEQFQKELEKINYFPSQINIISTVTGKLLSPIDMSCADYWLKHFRNTVLFSDAIVEAYNLGCQLYLEVGPGDVLKHLIQRQKKQRKPIFAFNTLPHAKDFENNPENTIKQLYNAIGNLWQYGKEIDWNGFWGDESGQVVSCPTYPFARKEYVILPDNIAESVKSQQLSLERRELAYYQPIWATDVSVALNEINKLNEKAVWLLFSDDLGFGLELKTLLKKHSQIVIFVGKGEAYCQKSVNEYMICPDKKEDVRQLFTTFSSLKLFPKYIIHLFSLSLQKEGDYGRPERNEFQANGFYSLINFSKIFLSGSYIPARIVVISNKTQKIFYGDEIIPEKATILGPCVVIPQEYTSNKVKFIDIDYSEQNTKSYADYVIEETMSTSSSILDDSVVGYRKGQRFIRSYHELNGNNILCNNLKKIVFKKNNIYLITGGLGQLGLNITKMIARQSSVKFILLSRSLLPNKDHWEEYLNQNDRNDKIALRIKTLKEIEKLGSEVYIYSFDIGQESECRKIISKIQEEVGLVNGIIHAAGITGEAALSPITYINESFVESQFSAKIYGLVNIMHMINTENLDFCVLFSSLASFMGGIGYAAYAAANQYLDAFATKGNNSNSQKPYIISINWDTWDFNNGYNNGIGVKPVVGLNKGFEALKSSIQGENISEIIVSDFGWLPRMNALSQLMVINKFAKEDEKSEEQSYEDNRGVVLDTKTRIVEVFKECLGIEEIGFDDDFYEIGGNSLSAVRFMMMLERELGIQISLSELNQARTANNLALLINKNENIVLSPFVELKTNGSKSPLFLFHPINGSISCYFELVKKLDYDGPIIGVQDIALNQKNNFLTFEEMASFYLSGIRKKQSIGPYKLAGSSLGGNLAYEVAKQLSDQGENISFLGLFDSWALFSDSLKDKTHFKNIMRERLSFLEKEIRETSIGFDDFLNSIWHRMELLCNYHPKQINIGVVLYKAMDLQPEYKEIDDPFNHWESYVNQIDLEFIPGDHDSMLKLPNVNVLAEKLMLYLR